MLLIIFKNKLIILFILNIKISQEFLTSIAGVCSQLKYFSYLISMVTHWFCIICFKVKDSTWTEKKTLILDHKVSLSEQYQY